MKTNFAYAMVVAVLTVLALAIAGCSSPPPKKYGQSVSEIAAQQDRDANAAATTTTLTSVPSNAQPVVPTEDHPKTNLLDRGDSIWRQIVDSFWRFIGNGGLLFFGVVFCIAALAAPKGWNIIAMAFGLLWAYFANTGPRAEAAESVGTLCILFAVSGLIGGFIPGWKKIGVPAVLIGGYFLLIIMNFITWTFS